MSRHTYITFSLALTFCYLTDNRFPNMTTKIFAKPPKILYFTNPMNNLQFQLPSKKTYFEIGTEKEH